MSFLTAYVQIGPRLAQEGYGAGLTVEQATRAVRIMPELLALYYEGECDHESLQLLCLGDDLTVFFFFFLQTRQSHHWYTCIIKYRCLPSYAMKRTANLDHLWKVQLHPMPSRSPFSLRSGYHGSNLEYYSQHFLSGPHATWIQAGISCREVLFVACLNASHWIIFVNVYRSDRVIFTECSKHIRGCRHTMLVSSYGRRSTSYRAVYVFPALI